MKIDQTINGNRMEIAVKGNLDAVTSPKFEADVIGQLEGITELNIDLGAVEYVSSAGLRVLLYLHQTMEGKNGTLTICNVPEVVMTVFGVTGFSDIVSIV